MISEYKIISLRLQAKGVKQRDVTSAGRFTSYEEACKVADKMNETSERIYTTYSAIKIYNRGA